MYFKNYLLRQLQYKPWPLSFSAFKTLTMPPADNPKQPPESGHVRLYPQNALQKVNIVTNSRKKSGAFICTFDSCSYVRIKNIEMYN